MGKGAVAIGSDSDGPASGGEGPISENGVAGIGSRPLASPFPLAADWEGGGTLPVEGSMPFDDAVHEPGWLPPSCPRPCLAFPSNDGGCSLVGLAYSLSGSRCSCSGEGRTKGETSVLPPASRTRLANSSLPMNGGPLRLTACSWPRAGLDRPEELLGGREEDDMDREVKPTPAAGASAPKGTSPVLTAAGGTATVEGELNDAGGVSGRGGTADDDDDGAEDDDARTGARARTGDVGNEPSQRSCSSGVFSGGLGILNAADGCPRRTYVSIQEGLGGRGARGGRTVPTAFSVSFDEALPIPSVGGPELFLRAPILKDWRLTRRETSRSGTLTDCFFCVPHVEVSL